MKKSSSAARRSVILERVERDRDCDIPALAAALRVSEMTVRRDLDALASEGRVIRTHGGATAARGVIFEFAFLERANHNRMAKEEIARIAAGLIRDGNTVILDSGTTTLEVARQLGRKKGITVITTSLPVASALQHFDEVDVILLGGRLRRETPDLSGALTLQALSNLHADMAFLGADAVTMDGGVYNASIDVAHLLAAMAAAADHIYVTADSSKIGRSALGRIGALQEMDGLITDSTVPTDTLRSLADRGIKVLVSSSSKGKRNE